MPAANQQPDRINSVPLIGRYRILHERLVFFDMENCPSEY